MTNHEHTKHERSAVQLLERLAVPASDATVLTWFDGKDRKIVLLIKRKALKRVAMQIPISFDGYPVEVEDYRVAMGGSSVVGRRS